MVTPSGRAAAVEDDREYSVARCAVDEHDVRLFLHALEDDFASIRRYVEVPDVDVSRKTGQLAFRSGHEIDLPKIFVLDVPTHDHQRSLSPQETQASGSTREREVRNRCGVPLAVTPFTANVVPMSAPE